MGLSPGQLASRLIAAGPGAQMCLHLGYDCGPAYPDAHASMSSTKASIISYGNIPAFDVGVLTTTGAIRETQETLADIRMY